MSGCRSSSGRMFSLRSLLQWRPRYEWKWNWECQSGNDTSRSEQHVISNNDTRAVLRRCITTIKIAWYRQHTLIAQRLPNRLKVLRTAAYRLQQLQPSATAAVQKSRNPTDSVASKLNGLRHSKPVITERFSHAPISIFYCASSRIVAAVSDSLWHNTVSRHINNNLYSLELNQ